MVPASTLRYASPNRHGPLYIILATPGCRLQRRWRSLPSPACALDLVQRIRDLHSCARGHGHAGLDSPRARPFDGRTDGQTREFGIQVRRQDQRKMCCLEVSASRVARPLSAFRYVAGESRAPARHPIARLARKRPWNSPDIDGIAFAAMCSIGFSPSISITYRPTSIGPPHCGFPFNPARVSGRDACSAATHVHDQFGRSNCHRKVATS